jgi:hypothetical protein
MKKVPAFTLNLRRKKKRRVDREGFADIDRMLARAENMRRAGHRIIGGWETETGRMVLWPQEDKAERMARWREDEGNRNDGINLDDGVRMYYY